MSEERLTARIVGRVQGVGFRWWVVQQASGLGLTGWVSNADGERAVDLVAEGSVAAIGELERRLWSGPDGARVEDVRSRRGTASGEFAGFGIVRG